MTVISTDITFMHRLTTIVSSASVTNSPISIDSIAVFMASIMESTLIAVCELIEPPAAFTTCCPTSKTAIAIVKVLLTR